MVAVEAVLAQVAQPMVAMVVQVVSSFDGLPQTRQG